MEKVKWGIIGCGDVAELKSGPAFQKSSTSELLAVMRRNSEKAKDFAERHKVPLWYDNLDDLLKNQNINAVYIATPPATHLEITLKSIKAGKNIYLEKPMALDPTEALKIAEALQGNPVKLTIAHYRRKMPAFLKIKELLEQEVIGKLRLVDIQIFQPSKSDIIADTSENWRIDPAISGGGYFHDLAPHQIDLMYYFFGDYDRAEGFSVNQSQMYKADDLVNGIIQFKNGVQLRGVWCFNVSEIEKKDSCIIYGSKGSIEFSFYGDNVKLNLDTNSETFSFEPIPHVQQPMIETTNNYFLGNSSNPCSAEEGLVTMRIMDAFI